MKCGQCDSDNPEDAQHCGKCGISLDLGASAHKGMVSFRDAIKLGFEGYFNFNGRSTRAEYWYWVLFVLLANLALLVVDAVIGVGSLLTSLWELATLIPGLALGARRLHDINKSGWWQLIWLFFPMAAIGGGILLASFFLLDNFLILTVLGFAVVIVSGILGIIGSIVLIVWACTRGLDAENKYGPSLLASD